MAQQLSIYPVYPLNSVAPNDPFSLQFLGIWPLNIWLTNIQITHTLDVYMVLK